MRTRGGSSVSDWSSAGSPAPASPGTPTSPPTWSTAIFRSARCRSGTSPTSPKMAHDLGAPIVRVFTGYESPAAAPQAQWKIVVEALRECARRAADCTVTIGVQNHHDLACGYESLDELLAEVDEPNCRAMFDAWAPALQGVDLIAAASRLAARTVPTTIATYHLRPR